MRTSTTARLLTFTLTLLAAACGAAEPEGREAENRDAVADQAPPAEPPKEDEWLDDYLARQDRRTAASFPCSLLTQEEVAELVGNPVEIGTVKFVNRSENERTWQSQECFWSGTTEDGADAAVWVSQPQHFEAGRVECIPHLRRARAVTGIGTSAEWLFERWGLGRLRVCTERTLFEVSVRRRGASEDELRPAALRVAERILERTEGGR